MGMCASAKLKGNRLRKKCPECFRDIVGTRICDIPDERGLFKSSRATDLLLQKTEVTSKCLHGIALYFMPWNTWNNNLWESKQSSAAGHVYIVKMVSQISSGPFCSLFLTVLLLSTSSIWKSRKGICEGKYQISHGVEIAGKNLPTWRTTWKSLTRWLFLLFVLMQQVSTVTEILSSLEFPFHGFFFAAGETAFFQRKETKISDVSFFVLLLPLVPLKM